MSSNNMINIRSDVKDKFYRYKMPKLVSKIEGRGNGIKTVIPNMSDICKALSRPPSYATKLLCSNPKRRTDFGFELGALTKIDERTDRYVVNGAHEADKLQGVLDGFITKFVLCPSCKNPETDLIIQKDDSITRNCNACGANMPVDIRHKLCAFIIKNPPAISNATAKARAAADKATNRSMNLASDSAAVAPDQDDADGGDADADQDQILDAFAAFVTETLASSTPDADTQIIEKASDLGIKDTKAVVILVQVLFTPSEAMLATKQVAHHAPLLHYFVKSEKTQKALLGGIETFVSNEETGARAVLLERVALVLKAFYDEELLDEDVCLAWADKVSKKYVDKKTAKEIREKAEPFVHWLKTAEVEDDSDDDAE
ncbi:hypothetical protein HDU83_007407 [Entophlyctis luteolus]|nr:hypothetical protein HDU83_007407 [Entophlyctis luteolus]